MPRMDTLKNICHCVWVWLLDTIAPQDPLVRSIENKGAEDFAQFLCPREAHGVISFFPYKNETVKTALIELKTHRNRTIAGIVGVSLFEALAEYVRKESVNSKALLFPLPITKKKRRARGWNQCDLIVAAIAAADGKSILEVRMDILIKHRDTDDQVGKDRTERFKNVANTCRITKPDVVRGRTVVVIDDIVTTGATLQEAKRALAEAGAGKVILMSVAY
jgi:competence protein ComFC